MNFKSVVAGVLLLATPNFAQTITELLQQGIYAQETSGNLDEAISIYRQVVTLASARPDIAAQAQYRIAETFLQKGNLTTAAAEFQKLARDFPNQQKLLRGSKVAVTLQRAGVLPAGPAPPAEPTGVLNGNHYHHNPTGTEFDLPTGWSIGITKPIDGNPQEMTVLVDPDGRAIFASAAMSKVETPPSSISGALSRAVPQLLARRAGSLPPHRVAGYQIRSGSVQQTVIGGNQAVQAIGEYQQGGQSIAEILAWIYTEHTRVYFFAKTAANDLPDLQISFEQLVQSARIP
jgi:tetratricopeptide (TPR) repeat protein